MNVHNNPWRGLTVQSSFTWATDIASTMIARGDQGNEDVNYPFIWEGPDQLTPRFLWPTAFAYQLPFGPGKLLGAKTHGLVAGLAEGWRVNGIVEITSGVPNIVTTTDDTSGTGYGVMPNRTCNPNNVPGGRNYLEWFNTSCFIEAPFGTFGNSPMGAYTDPGINNWSLSVGKTIPVRFPAETGRIEFRAECFNIWNHTQFGPANDVTLATSPTAGRISTTRPPRMIDFSLIYSF